MATPLNTCSSRFRSALILAMLLMAAAGGWAAERPTSDDLLGEAPPPAPADGSGGAKPPDTPEAQRKATAQGLMRAGQESVRLFNQDNQLNANAIVDAAIAFGKARQLLDETADVELVQQVQANLFWCKKQMNLDALALYIKNKGGEGQSALQAMDAASASAPPEQAAAYFASAEKWAGEHANDHLQIAVRFLEVAERFPSTTEGTEANKRVVEATRKMMSKAAADAAEARRTRFMAPVPVTSGTKLPQPDADAQKAAMAMIRKNWAKGYQKQDAAGKRRLAGKLLAAAPENRADAALYFTMVDECIRLAGECEDYVALLDGADLLAAGFAAYDATVEKKLALGRNPGRPVAAAIATLLDNPTDPGANLIAGKWFCFSAHSWTEGVRMLAQSGDPSLDKLIKLELDKPRDAPEKIVAGDAWYDLGKKTTRKDDRLGMLGRAMTWYQESVESLSGLAKDRVVGRMAEIDKLLPLDLDNIDWNALTASQWDKLKGLLVVVAAKSGQVESGLVLVPGKPVRVVPHPSETWVASNSWFGKKTVNWRGWDGIERSAQGNVNYAVERYTEGSQRVGALICWTDRNARQVGGVISGTGQLFLAMSKMKPEYGGEYQGQLRVKILPVEE